MIDAFTYTRVSNKEHRFDLAATGENVNAQIDLEVWDGTDWQLSLTTAANFVDGVVSITLEGLEPGNYRAKVSVNTDKDTNTPLGTIQFAVAP